MVKNIFNNDKLGLWICWIDVEFRENFDNNLNDIAEIIKENHKLLNYIGVVPSTINNFIGQIEQTGASAKICGAGATARQIKVPCLLLHHPILILMSCIIWLNNKDFLCSQSI